MEFKVGDRVRIVNEDICGKNRIGKICEKFSNYGNINRNLYEVDVGATYPYEIFEEDLELYEEKEVIAEFIPNDRLETKVEVKTKVEIKLENLEQRIEKLEEILGNVAEMPKPSDLFVATKSVWDGSDLEEEEAFMEEMEIQKPSLLTEDERVILRNLDKDFKWIARDFNDELDIYEKCPEKKEYFHSAFCWRNGGCCESLDMFPNLFKFIKSMEEPYNIEELLKGEIGNEKK